MVCPKCGYARQPEDKECALCGADFEILEKEEEDRKKLKEMARKQAEQDEVPEEVETAAAAPMSMDFDENSDNVCPKCGYDKTPDDKECSNCGIIFKKLEGRIAAQKEADKKKQKEEAKRIAKQKAKMQKLAQEGIAKEKAKRKAKAKAKKAAEKAAKVRDKARNEAQEKIVKNKKTMIGITIVVILLIIGVSSVGIYNLPYFKEQRLEKKRLIAEEAEKRRLEEERRKNVAYFNTNKETVLENLYSKLEGGNLYWVQQELSKYNYPELDNTLADIKNKLEEKQLFKKSQSLPASEVDQNYKIFIRLIELNPESKLYKKKAKHYGIKFAENYFKKERCTRADLIEATNAIDTAIKYGGKSRKYKDLKNKLIAAKLTFYEGNENLVMAVKDYGVERKGPYAGQRKIFVSLKNISSRPLHINPEFFSMTDKNGRRVPLNECSNSLVVNLQPGTEVRGNVYFNTYSKPKSINFDHVLAGNISRVF